MKTKNKLLALLEIAVVLCSVLLVAIPAIAAEQNAQKVSATEVATASKDDYVLGVYGNGNEDDTIDMGDVVYIKLAIFGKKPKTELCDAKYDGRINVLDVIQTKLIILGKEKELTIIDNNERTVTVEKPVKKVVCGPQAVEAIKALKAEDKMVGVTNRIIGWDVLFPELSKLPSIGTWSSPDYEVIVELKPDLVIWLKSRVPTLEAALEPAGITVVGIDFYRPETLIEETRKLGYIIDKEDEANELIDWYNGYMDTIKQRTNTLSEEDKPRVYLAKLSDYTTITRGCGEDRMISVAGGRNIAADLGGPDISIKVDEEWVVRQNPEVIIKVVHAPAHGYKVDDPSEMRAARDAILNLPELAETTAITTERVYLFPWIDLVVTYRSVIGTAYTAKWLHPKLFEDLDPQAIHQEYLDRFMRINYDLDEHGVFVYPEPS